VSVAEQALALARIEAGQASPEDRARLIAWDRLYSLLGTLDSKTSVLLRFNAIVVAALAYVTVVRSADPFVGVNPTIATIGVWVGHISLVLSVASCGFAFPVINVEWSFLHGRIAETAGKDIGFDDAALNRVGALVARRTWLYSWAWRFAVAGGVGFALLVALATIH
jgi:hypothetical protein